MADLEEAYQEVHEKPAVYRREASRKRVRAELNQFNTTDRCTDLNVRHEEGQTNSPKRLKGDQEEKIQIPGGHAYTTKGLQYPVSDAELGQMSVALGRNWQLLGLSMGLESVDIEQCEESNQRSVQLQICEMLRRWKRENSERATMYELIQAIIKNKASVSWNKVDDIINEHFQN